MSENATKPPEAPLAGQSNLSGALSNVPPASVSKNRQQASKKKIASTVKRVAWRATGIYVWFEILRKVLFGQSPTESQLGKRLAEFLSSIGFAPIDATQLVTIVKIGWVLIVTSFKPVEILGLAIYLTFFLVLPLAIYLTHGIEASKDNDSATETTKQLGLVNTQVRGDLPFLFAAWGCWLG